MIRKVHLTLLSCACSFAMLYVPTALAQDVIQQFNDTFFGEYSTPTPVPPRSDGSYVLYAKFVDVGPLKVGDAVKVAGVHIGQIESIDLTIGSDAKVMLRINKGHEIFIDDILSIHSLIGSQSTWIKVARGGTNTAIASGGTILDTESWIDVSGIAGRIELACRGVEDEKCARQILQCLELAKAEQR